MQPMLFASALLLILARAIARCAMLVLIALGFATGASLRLRPLEGEHHG
jgi:hypothetical protein